MLCSASLSYVPKAASTKEAIKEEALKSKAIQFNMKSYHFALSTSTPSYSKPGIICYLFHNVCVFPACYAKPLLNLAMHWKKGKPKFPMHVHIHVQVHNFMSWGSKMYARPLSSTSMSWFGSILSPWSRPRSWPCDPYPQPWGDGGVIRPRRKIVKTPKKKINRWSPPRWSWSITTSFISAVWSNLVVRCGRGRIQPWWPQVKLDLDLSKLRELVRIMCSCAAVCGPYSLLVRA